MSNPFKFTKKTCKEVIKLPGFDRGIKGTISGGKRRMIVAYINRSISLEQLDDDELKPVMEKGDYNYFYAKTGLTRHPITEEPCEIVLDASFSELSDQVSKGDTIITSTLLNFSLSIVECMRFIRDMHSKGVCVIAVFEGFDSREHIIKNCIDMHYFIEKYDEYYGMEMHIRQRKGIEKARKDNRYESHKNNGKRAFEPDQFENFFEIYTKIKNDRLTKKNAAEQLGISRPTLDRLIIAYEESIEE